MSRESVYFLINKIDEKYDIKNIKRELDSLKGILSVSVNDKTNRVAVDYDAKDVEKHHIKNKIINMGYHILDMHTENHTM